MRSNNGECYSYYILYIYNPGSVSLVDVSSYLIPLKRSPGLRNWQVVSFLLYLYLGSYANVSHRLWTKTELGILRTQNCPRTRKDSSHHLIFLRCQRNPILTNYRDGILVKFYLAFNFSIISLV